MCSPFVFLFHKSSSSAAFFSALLTSRRRARSIFSRCKNTWSMRMSSGRARSPSGLPEADILGCIQWDVAKSRGRGVRGQTIQVALKSNEPAQQPRFCVVWRQQDTSRRVQHTIFPRARSSAGTLDLFRLFISCRTLQLHLLSRQRT